MASLQATVKYEAVQYLRSLVSDTNTSPDIRFQAAIVLLNTVSEYDLTQAEQVERERASVGEASDSAG